MKHSLHNSLSLVALAVGASACTAILGGFDFNGKASTAGAAGAGGSSSTTTSSTSSAGTGGSGGAATSTTSSATAAISSSSTSSSTGSGGATASSSSGTGGATASSSGGTGGMPACCGAACPTKCAVGQSCSMDADCESVANGKVTCQGGTCTLACSYGWGDCDGKGDCATNLLTTASNCGSCGTQCSAYCVNGTCNDPIAVATGDNHTCAILVDGSVWCWGDDTFGQLGDAPRIGKNPVPQKVAGLPGPASQYIAAGAANTCVILMDHTLWCWGDNTSGTLGVGDTNPHIGPQQVTALSKSVGQVAVGDHHACAYTGGGVYCWGSNGSGQVGNGTTGAAVPTPTLVLPSGVSVAAGNQYTCAIVVPNDTVSCWGSNEAAQFGDGTTNSSSTPTPGGMGLSNLDFGLFTSSTSTTTCAGSSTAGVYCWGTGPLGNGSAPSATAMAPPATPMTFPGLIFFAVGGKVGGVASSSLYMWGDNSDGQLGDGTNNPQSSPEKIALQVSKLAIGATHVCALSGFTLYCWGENGYGQLSTSVAGSETTSPVAVAWP